MSMLDDRNSVINHFLKKATDTTIASKEIEPSGNESDLDVFTRLAQLVRTDYDRSRKIEAKRLGIQLSTLDDEVHKLRPKSDQDESLPFPIVEPFHQPVQPAALLDELAEVVKRFIILEPYQADCVALWIAFTWFTDSVHVSPLLLVNAPERACGKSQLLELVSRLVSRPLPVANCSTAALFRSIELWKPTLTIDEADTFFSENIELAGLINAGHTRASAFVLRTVGDDHTPTRFSVWAAKALAGIQLEKHLPNATMSRGLVINLRRKLPHENVSRLRHADTTAFNLLASKLARFAQDFIESIVSARPTLPDELDDRNQDNWEPLLSIASCAGANWIKRATEAALQLAESGSDSQSAGAELLTDIRNIFDAKSLLKISFKDLLAKLTEDDELPWSTYNRGKPIAARQITKRLAAFGVKSKTVRMGNDVAKGYELDQFTEVFSRYLPDTPVNPDTTVTRLQPAPVLGLSVAKNGDVTVIAGYKSTNDVQEPSLDAACNRVTNVTAIAGAKGKAQESETFL
jgi:putative DNA primase/helicase